MTEQKDDNPINQSPANDDFSNAQAPVEDQNVDSEVDLDAPLSGTVDGQEAEPDPFAVLEKLNAENAELKDRALRALAEMENLRRRSQKEVADAKAYGVTGFAHEMLGFADNIRRALENMPEELRQDTSPAKSFIEGIELTEKDFQTRLKRHGVVKLEPQGKKFDPNMHEALYEVPDPSVPAGTVVQIVEDGYAIGERCLRPAKVGVARGGPKEAPAEQDDAGKSNAENPEN